MKYFTDCKTAEELKKEYKIQAKKLHPDNGGNEGAFKEMQAEFSTTWERLKNIHMNAEGETYSQETAETAGEYMDIIEILIHLDGVETEICGRWIWCSGETRQHKNTLKSLGFRFSRNKTAWYYHTGSYRRRHDRDYTLEDIRDMYGSQRYANQNKEDIPRIATV